MRLRRPRWRRLLVVAAVLLVLIVAGGYGILAILTRNAPPPPSLNRTPPPSFDVALDGRWYSKTCGSIQILGGWLLPDTAALPIPIAEPVDLTDLEHNGRPKRVDLDAAETLEIRWSGERLLLERARGTLALVHEKPEAC